MADPKEIPQLTTELVDMSREYLRQETIEPAKRLGKHAGLGIGGAFALSLGAICLTWAFYYGLTQLFEATVSGSRWWVVASRLATALAAGATAGVIGWRISKQSDSTTTTETA